MQKTTAQRCKCKYTMNVIPLDINYSRQVDMPLKSIHQILYINVAQ